MSEPADPAELLALAEQAAEAAGMMLASERRKGLRPEVAGTKTSPADIVTELDRASEALIRELILSERPGDAFIGEESGESGGGRVRWIVDPLDGTVNFLHGLPDWSVSIAAEVDGTVVSGAVYVPGRDAMFTAAAGDGARMNDASMLSHAWKITPSDVTALREALVDTAFGYDPARAQVQAGVVAGVLPHVRGVRCRGSAAMDLCSVAAGRTDAYYEAGLKMWDIAAGALIAREAGAVVTGLDGKPAGPEMLLAAAPGIAAELGALLVFLDAERSA